MAIRVHFDYTTLTAQTGRRSLAGRLVSGMPLLRTCLALPHSSVDLCLAFVVPCCRCLPALATTLNQSAAGLAAACGLAASGLAAVGLAAAAAESGGARSGRDDARLRPVFPWGPAHGLAKGGMLITMSRHVLIVAIGRPHLCIVGTMDDGRRLLQARRAPHRRLVTRGPSSGYRISHTPVYSQYLT